MNKIEYMRSLGMLLSDIAADEKENVLQYYNDYFDDAGVEQESRVIEELGRPEQLAAMIKRDLRGDEFDVNEQGMFTEYGFTNPQFEEKPYEVAKKEAQEKQEQAFHYSGPYENSNVQQNQAQSGQGQYQNQNQYRGQNQYQRKVPGYEMVSNSLKNNKDRNLWYLLLLIVAIPLLMSVLGVGLGMVGGLFGIAVGILGFAAAGLGVIVGGLAEFIKVPANGILMVGSGLAMFGLGLLAANLYFRLCFRYIPRILYHVISWIQGFMRKGRKETE